MLSKLLRGSLVEITNQRFSLKYHFIWTTMVFQRKPLVGDFRKRTPEWCNPAGQASSTSSVSQFLCRYTTAWSSTTSRQILMFSASSNIMWDLLICLSNTVCLKPCSTARVWQCYRTPITPSTFNVRTLHMGCSCSFAYTEHMYVRTHMDGWVDACRYVHSSHVWDVWLFSLDCKYVYVHM